MKKNFKRVVSLFLALVVLISSFAVFTTDVFAATTIKTFSGTLGDWNYDFEGSFTLNQKTKINIKFNSDRPMDLQIYRYDDYYDEIYIVDKTDIRSLSTTYTVKAGKYYVDIAYYDCYDDYYNEIESDYYLKISNLTTYSTGIKLKSASKTMSVGKTVTLGYTLSPAGSVAKSLTWTTSNKNVATIDKNGKVTAKGLGKCIITAKLNNGKTSKCTVKVTSKKLYVFTNSSRTLPKINGKNTVKWKPSRKSVAMVSGQKVKGQSHAATVLKTTYGGVDYKIYLYSVSYDKLLKSTKSELRDCLKDPDSLKIYHVWRGYDSDGEPTVILDYGAKNSYGAMVRDNYCVGYYTWNSNSKSYNNYIYFKDYKISLTASKQVF